MSKPLRKEDLLKAYKTMREIREFEERVHTEFATGEIPGFVHLYAGEEAVATAVCLHLTDEDKITSTHRGHGHCIAKGVEIRGMMAEIYGRKNGTCGGKGGSMHIADLDKGMMGANGIVGAGPPLACGAALAARFRNTRGVGVAFFGDGASNQGTTFESLNLALIWKLPVVFIAENNGYAESTGVTWSVPATIAARAAGFGMPAIPVDGNDFFAVYEAAGESIGRARSGGGPSLIECRTNRFFGHFEGDSMTYRAPGEVKRLRESHDCLKIFSAKVIGDKLISAAELEAIDKEVLALVDDAVTKAKASPKPTEADLLTDVYVSY